MHVCLGCFFRNYERILCLYCDVGVWSEIQAADEELKAQIGFRVDCLIVLIEEVGD